MNEDILKRVEISDAIRFIGADDPELELFESQYPTEGISYNSYVILDDKIAIMDTVDERGIEEFLANVKTALADKKPDYLVIQHMEPDHTGGIAKLVEIYPDMKLVGSAKTGQMLPQFFNEDLMSRFVAVKENDTLSLGSHTLRFIMAPMVHWPEVMVTYEESEKVLFSADAFGTFSALCNNEEWIADSSHYYFNIVGKYGMNVQQLLKKASALDIACIAPLHGPVHKEDIAFVMETYDTWSSYKPFKKGIFIPYASIHGNTKKIALLLAEEFKKAGETVVTMDLTEEDVSEAVEQAFLYDRMILAACTYDGAIFPPMENFLNHLALKNFQNRKVGIIENGSWGPVAGKLMKDHLAAMKDITIADTMVTIRSTLKPDTAGAIKALMKEMM